MFTGKLLHRALVVCVTFVIAVTTGYSPTAAAEEADALIEEIVVTARKRAERLQDIPVSAAALDAGLIEDLGGVFGLRDITDLIAGISINETQEPTLTEPTIRGAGQSRNRASVSATGLYRNGAYFATSSLGGKNFARMDTYDLERVEVLRGPQGALYGRNALGGSMNLISKKPTNEFDLEVGLAAGQKDMQRYEAKVNIPINEQLAARVSYFHEDRDEGFYTDINGDYIDQEEFRHSRASLRYRPNQSWDITYVFDNQEETIAPAITTVTARTPDIDDAFRSTINTLHRNTNDLDNHNLTIDWTLPGGVLTSVSNYRDREVNVTLDNDYGAVNTNLINGGRTFLQDVSNQIIFQELRFVADGTSSFKWLVGADYFSHDNTEEFDQWQGALFANAQRRTVNMNADSWAAFGSAEYSFSDIPVTITGELRYAVDKIDGDVLTFRNRDRVVPQTDFAADDSFTNLPWSLTASYRFSEQDVMAYAKVASSYRQGGMNLNEGSPGLELYPAVLTYGEETSTTYEIGMKSSWFDRAVTLNAAAFYIFYDDFLNTTDNGCPADCQLVDVNGDGLGFNPDGSRIGEDADGVPIPPNDTIPTAFFIDNVGEVEAWGFEIETSYRKRFDFGGTLRFNLAYSRGRGQVESLNSDVSAATEAVAGGATLPFLRPDQVKSSVVYRQSLSGLQSVPGFAGASLVASASYTFEDGGLSALSNGNPAPLGTVKRVNANIGIEATKWSLFVRANNLTDQAYRAYATVVRYIPNRPRYVFGEFKYYFNR